ncbi:hypothetical protein SAMN04489730_0035 [Amycolatopsis australiensis]|uniref:Uncharacterized protein n=1 Tax=Amycolatopsis australiensis TaxID=546364 RepID=A0A1K1LL50_9PSEU|nr:hypothetical protein SAMN04489730_0035 [Amycolatopsis australiensis]
MPTNDSGAWHATLAEQENAARRARKQAQQQKQQQGQGQPR